jgi:hypothetical protein
MPHGRRMEGDICKQAVIRVVAEISLRCLDQYHWRLQPTSAKLPSVRFKDQAGLEAPLITAYSRDLHERVDLMPGDLVWLPGSGVATVIDVRATFDFDPEGPEPLHFARFQCEDGFDVTLTEQEDFMIEFA